MRPRFRRKSAPMAFKEATSRISTLIEIAKAQILAGYVE
jgi:hypothetical protein